MSELKYFVGARPPIPTDSQKNFLVTIIECLFLEPISELCDIQLELNQRFRS